MVSDAFTAWISPVLWFLLSVLWIAPAVMALRWPGGIGAVIFLIGTLGNALCFLISSASNCMEAFTGNPLIVWESWLWTLQEAFFLMSFALQAAGLFMLILRIKPIMNRIREFEALPPQG